MSAVQVRAALEKGLAAMSPGLAIADENFPFTPVAGAPYQRITLRFEKPINDEQTRGYIEQGLMQVDLFYPLGAGSGAATARAEMIRSTFYNGASFSSAGVTTNVYGTPELGPGAVDGDRWRQPVRIRFYAHITA